MFHLLHTSQYNGVIPYRYSLYVKLLHHVVVPANIQPTPSVCALHQQIIHDGFLSSSNDIRHGAYDFVHHKLYRLKN